MAKIFVFILIFISNSLNVLGSDLGICVQESPCVCKFNEYSLVNITSILGDQKPAYLDDTDAVSNYTYYFSGCVDYTLDNHTFSVCL